MRYNGFLSADISGGPAPGYSSGQAQDAVKRIAAETLPAGTEFSFLRTDNVSYVVMELADGRECRIDIVEIDWTPTINGVPEWECFENLMYAG